MKIILDGKKTYKALVLGHPRPLNEYHKVYLPSDTIEITDDEWNLIEKGFNDEARISEEYQYCFSRYIRELIKLKP
jgi:hypothetical protein